MRTTQPKTRLLPFPHVEEAPSPGNPGVFPWRGALAGFAAVLAGNGLGRFAYSSLIPPLVEAGWFTSAQAAYLGAANLAGYLLGSVSASRLSLSFPAPVLLRLSMAAIAAGFFCSMQPGPFAWFALWRFLAGVAGGILMILPAPALLARVGEAERHRMRGILFSGLGMGVILAATAVPGLLHWGLAWAWAGLGVLSLGLTLASWNDWPSSQGARQERAGLGGEIHRAPNRTRPPVPPPAAGEKESGARFSRPVGVLAALYCSGAVGLMPCTIFWVDYVARGLHRGMGLASFNWILFGVGCFLGPWLAADIGRRFGFYGGIRGCLFAMGMGDLLAAFFHQTPALGLVSLGVGIASMANVSLVLGRAGELTGLSGQKQAWGWMTGAFSVAMAVAAYGLSFLFARTDSYELVFIVGGAFPTGAVLVDLLATGYPWARKFSR